MIVVNARPLEDAPSRGARAHGGLAFASPRKEQQRNMAGCKQGPDHDSCPEVHDHLLTMRVGLRGPFVNRSLTGESLPSRQSTPGLVSDFLPSVAAETQTHLSESRSGHNGRG